MNALELDLDRVSPVAVTRGTDLLGRTHRRAALAALLHGEQLQLHAEGDGTVVASFVDRTPTVEAD